MPLSKRIELIAYLGAFSCLALAFWACDKGINFTDEGYTLLLAASPLDYQHLPHLFGIYLNAIFGFQDPGILGLRWLRLALVTPLAAIAAYSVSYWSYRSPQGASVWLRTWQLLPFGLLGALLSYCTLPQTPSYNTLADWLFILSTSFTLILTKQMRDGRVNFTSWPIAFCLGLTLSFLIFSKVVLSISLSLALGALLLLHITCYIHGLILLWLLAGWLSGVGITAILFHSFDQTIFKFYDQIISHIKTLYYFKISSTAHQSLIERTILDVGSIAIQTAIYLIPLASLLLAWALIRHLNPSLRKHNYATIWLLLLTFIGTIYTFKLYSCGFQNYTRAIHAYTALTTLIIYLYTVVLRHSQSFSKLLAANWNTDFAWAVFFTTSPLIAAFGTGNNIHVNALLHFSFFYIFIGMLIFKFTEEVKDIALGAALTTIASILVTAHVYGGLYEKPFFQPPLKLATQPVLLAESKGAIKLEHDQAALVKEIRKLLHSGGFQAQDPIVALYNLPTLVYIANGSAPGVPWIPDNPDFHPLLGKFVRATLENWQASQGKIFLLVTDTTESVLNTHYLPSSTPFPGAFKLLGSTHGFYVYVTR
jgi:hypothetical protein